MFAKLIIDLIMANMKNGFSNNLKYLPKVIKNLYELKGIIETDIPSLNEIMNEYFKTTFEMIDTIKYLSMNTDTNAIIEKFEKESKELREKLQNSRV